MDTVEIEVTVGIESADDPKVIRCTVPACGPAEMVEQNISEGIQTTITRLFDDDIVISAEGMEGLRTLSRDF